MVCLLGSSHVAIPGFEDWRWICLEVMLQASAWTYHDAAHFALPMDSFLYCPCPDHQTSSLLVAYGLVSQNGQAQFALAELQDYMAEVRLLPFVSMTQAT